MAEWSEWHEPWSSVWGAPAVEPPPGGVRLRDSRRWAWVWMADGVNHGLHVDDLGGYFQVEAWVHRQMGETPFRVQIKQYTRPTDLALRKLAAVVWPDPQTIRPKREQCCCAYGAAVSGEYPEFGCAQCPIHQASLGETELCGRHQAERNDEVAEIVYPRTMGDYGS